MLLRLGCKMAAGAAGLAVAGALAAGVAVGVAGAAVALAASARFRPPGARWPAEHEHNTDAGMAGDVPAEP